MDSIDLARPELVDATPPENLSVLMNQKIRFDKEGRPESPFYIRYTGETPFHRGFFNIEPKTIWRVLDKGLYDAHLALVDENGEEHEIIEATPSFTGGGTQKPQKVKPSFPIDEKEWMNKMWAIVSANEIQKLKTKKEND